MFFFKSESEVVVRRVDVLGLPTDRTVSVLLLVSLARERRL